MIAKENTQIYENENLKDWINQIYEYPPQLWR